MGRRQGKVVPIAQVATRVLESRPELTVNPKHFSCYPRASPAKPKETNFVLIWSRAQLRLFAGRRRPSGTFSLARRMASAE